MRIRRPCLEVLASPEAIGRAAGGGAPRRGLSTEARRVASLQGTTGAPAPQGHWGPRTRTTGSGGGGRARTGGAVVVGVQPAELSDRGGEVGQAQVAVAVLVRERQDARRQRVSGQLGQRLEVRQRHAVGAPG